LFHQLAEYYIRNNEQEKAKAVLDRWNEVIGINTKRYFIPAYLSIVSDYDLLNENEKANEIRDIIKSKLSTLYDYNSRQQMTEEQAAKITEWLDE
jgi:cell division protein FtsI/penicillin-binding protein 2